MKIRLEAEAEAEVHQAIAYLNAQRPDLGREFAEEISRGLDRILEFPGAWPPIDRRVRRYLLNRFSYSLVYHIEADEIVILALAHHKRRPDYWRDRLKPTF